MLFFPIFLLGFFGLWIFTVVFWITKLVEVARLPDAQFKAAGTEKLTWILVVALAGIIGAIVWHFAKREEVLAAAGRAFLPPPGWYPQPGTGAPRWWDGNRWL